jgi:cobalt-zinc-cadmium efflux system outer membrane protein
LEILKNTRQKLDEIREIIAENYKQGEASAIDTARIGIVLKDTEVEKYNVEKILDQKKRELLTLLDLSQDQNHINFVEPYGQYKIQEEKKSLRDSMIEHNPLLRQLLNSYEREGIQLSLEKRKNIPDITAAGGYKKEDTFDTYSFSLSFNLPIFNQRKGEIEIAKNNLRMNKLQQRLFKKELTEAFENEYSKYSKADVLIQLFKSQYLNQADKLEDTTLAAYKGGEVNILFLVDALHSAHKTRIEFIDLTLQNNISVFSIEKLVGAELNVEKM